MGNINEEVNGKVVAGTKRFDRSLGDYMYYSGCSYNKKGSLGRLCDLILGDPCP